MRACAGGLRSYRARQPGWALHWARRPPSQAAAGSEVARPQEVAGEVTAAATGAGGGGGTDGSLRVSTNAPPAPTAIKATAANTQPQGTRDVGSCRFVSWVGAAWGNEAGCAPEPLAM